MPSSVPESPSAATGDLVSLSGQPLESGGGARLAATAGASGSSLASQAGGGLPALAMQYFTPTEWTRLNPGKYHDAHHPVHVAETVGEVAQNLGRTPERARFLQAVALLHDVDERINLTTGEQNPTSPARVPVTLEWIDRNQAVLGERLGWGAADFAEARALIARTDFPFNEQPKSLGTRYDGQTPVGLYEKLLAEVPAERRQQTLEDGMLLRFADQAGNYTVSREQSERYIDGLAQEMRGVGVPITTAELAKGSPDFLRAVGQDVEHDWNIASHLGLSTTPLASREQLVDALSPQRQEVFLSQQ